jgi:hypothetical protein
VADLLAKGSKMPLGADRDAVYTQAEKIGIDAALIIPIYHGTRSALVSSRLGGTAIDANSIIRFALIKPA